MTHTVPTINKYKLFIAFFTAFLLFSLGCQKQKQEEDYSAKFSGTWKGIGGCSEKAAGLGGLLNVSATDKKTISLSYTVGEASCLQAKVLSGITNTGNVTFDKITVTDGCGVTYTLDGSGSIVGDSLILTINQGGINSGQCTFRGTKQ